MKKTMSNNFDISDDEIRYIGGKTIWYKTRQFRISMIVVCSLLLVVIGILFHIQAKSVESYSEQNIDSYSTLDSIYRLNYPDPFADVDTSVSALYIFQDTISDIAVRFFYPVKANVQLRVGSQTPEPNTMLILPAAGTRADNNDILGAFVLKGELLSKGQSKAGYCAIINDSLHIGCEQATAFMEEAIDQNGYFFRQYPLVHNGTMVDTKRREKATRRSLCKFKGKYVVIECLTRESMINFMLLLQDLAVEEAIYLPGANCWGWYSDGVEVTEFGFRDEVESPRINFIAWTYDNRN